MDKKSTKVLVLSVLAILILGALFLFLNQNQNQEPEQSKTESSESQKKLKIGAILPLTGPGSVYGNSLQEGMEVASKKLNQEGFDLEVIYEDSKATSVQGVNAYNKLVNIDKVDVVISVFSRVTTPLMELSEKNKTPLLALVTSNPDITGPDNDYVFRFWFTAKQHGETHFDNFITKEKYNDIAILAVDDEYGSSVAKVMENIAEEKGINVAFSERYDPNESDFKSILIKIKQKDPEALIQTGLSPQELIEILKAKKEIDWDVDFFEVGNTLALESTREEFPDLVRGVYTQAPDFALGKTGDQAREFLESKNLEVDSFWVAAAGYDSLMFLKEAKANQGDQENLAEAISSLGEFNSLNGLVEIKDDGEINPSLRTVLINQEGELEEAKE